MMPIDPQVTQATAALDQHNVEMLERRAKKGGDDVQSVAEQFEALFVGEVLKAMRKTVGASDVSFGTQVFEGMFDEEISKQVAHTGLGIAAMLKDAIKG